MSTPNTKRPRRWWRRHERWLVAAVVLLWAGAMMPLVPWGLPSRLHDEILFGGEPAWPAERLLAAAEIERLSTRTAGADTDLDPITTRNRLVELTAGEAGRAEILRRYRLYSRQPDEMIIFRALQRMDPRQLDFDPRLYQYGGGYIYLVGLGLGLAHVLGAADVTNTAAFYIDHPESFARFYIVARVLSVSFGALTLVAIYKLARRAAGRSAGWIAMLLTALTPVFITATLEAKPHLPAACLTLWATRSALDLRRRSHLLDALRLGVQAGYAFGLVLTGLAAWLLLPASWLAANRPRRLLLKVVLGVGLAVAVYAGTNPYVIYNSLFRRSALSSNLQNSLAMYADQAERLGAGTIRVIELLVESTGWLIPVLGLLAFFVFWRRNARATWTVAVPGLAMLLLGALLGAGKPGEFARFLILPCLLLTLAASALIARWARTNGWALILVGVAFTLARPGSYFAAFLAEVRGHDSRQAAAAYLQGAVGRDESIGLIQEPAPYAVPPLDFAHRRIVLLPAAPPAELDPETLPAWLVYTADDDEVHAGAWWREWYAPQLQFPPHPRSWPRGMIFSRGATRIAWADKPVFILQRSPDGPTPARPSTRAAAAPFLAAAISAGKP